MNFMLIAEITIISLIISLIFLGTSFIFFQKIFLPYKKTSEPMPATEVFETLSAIISLEIDIYEKNIFENKGNFLDSASFENYYNKITYQILSDIPPEFFKRASYYMNEDTIAQIVSRSVMAYLSNKLATTGNPVSSK